MFMDTEQLISFRVHKLFIFSAGIQNYTIYKYSSDCYILLMVNTLFYITPSVYLRITFLLNIIYPVIDHIERIVDILYIYSRNIWYKYASEDLSVT